MPFCESCSRYWTPSAMTPQGSCPTCGRHLDKQPVATQGISTGKAHKIDVRQLAAGDGETSVKAPWHFTLLVVGLAVYMGWRVVALFL